MGAVRPGVGVVDSLPEDVSRRTSGLEIVALVEGLAKAVDLGFLGGGAQDNVVGNETGFGLAAFQKTALLPILGWCGCH